MDINKQKSAIYPLFATPVMVCGEEYKVNEDELNYIKNLKSNSFIASGNENRRTKSSDVLEYFDLSSLNFRMFHYHYNFIIIRCFGI